MRPSSHADAAFSPLHAVTSKCVAKNSSRRYPGNIPVMERIVLDRIRDNIYSSEKWVRCDKFNAWRTECKIIIRNR